jgi:predicted Zn-dependent protease
VTRRRWRPLPGEYVIGLFSKLAPWRRGLVKAVVACVLLAVVGVGLLPPYFSLRFSSHLRDARQDLERHDLVAARSHLRICRDMRPGDPEVHLLQARASRRGGFLADAEYRLNLCKELGGSDEAITLERSLLRVQQGRWSLPLEQQLQTYIDQNHPDLPAILDTLSQGYTEIYRLDSARYCLDLWLERQPNNVRALLRRGWVRERQHQFEEAAEDYRQAAAAEADNTTAQLRLAQVLLYLDRIQEASALFESLRQRGQDDVPVVLGLARCRRKRGETEAAERLLEELTARAPRDSAVLLERGRLALEQQKREQAENWLRQAVELAPYDYQTNYSLYLCLNQRDKKEEAEEYHRRVGRIEADMKRMNELTERLQARPYDADLRCEVGQLFLRNGQPREGVLWLQSALQVAPDHRPTHQALAEHYEQDGKADLAAPHRRFLQAPSGTGPPALEGDLRSLSLPARPGPGAAARSDPVENIHDRPLSEPGPRP